MTGKEKRQTIRQLKQDRDQAVVQAQKDYYHKRSGTYRPSNNNNGTNNNRNDNDNNDQSNNSGSE